MNRILAVPLTLASLIFLFSCSSSKKVAKEGLVPFTRELNQRLEKENIDLKQVQFYIDQRLVLSRVLGDQKVEVTSGVVKLKNGKYINEVIVPAFTPGICDGIENERLMISFEKGNNNLAFGPGSGDTFNQYVLYGTDWKNGTAAVTFDSNKFRARCGSCQDVAFVSLFVRKSEIDKIGRKTRILKGRTVNN